MANYEKIETLVKKLAELTDDSMTKMISNENIDVSTLSDREKFSILIFEEMKKAIDNKDHELLLDCNYAKSGFHNKTEKQLAKGQENTWLVDYFRVVTRGEVQKSLIQVYVYPDVKNGSCRFNLSTSCERFAREQFTALEDELNFHIKRRPDGTARWTERANVGYDELAEVVKQVCAVLSACTKVREEKKKDTEDKKKEKKTTKNTKKPKVEETPNTEESTEE